MKNKQEPVLAVTIYALETQAKVIEKLNEVLEYMKSLTEKEFEAKHVTNGCIINVVNLAPDVV